MSFRQFRHNLPTQITSTFYFLPTPSAILQKIKRAYNPTHGFVADTVRNLTVLCHDMRRRASDNSTFAIGGVTCFYDTFVVNQSLVLRINICGENRHLRQARKRQAVKKPLFFLFWAAQPFLRLIFAVYLRFKKGFFQAAFCWKISKCAPMSCNCINLDESRRILL